MKLSKEALLEIVAIVQDGIFEGKDISNSLRALDLDVKADEASIELILSPSYVQSHPRAAVWEENTENN